MFGDKLKAIRLHQELSQAEVAKHLNIAQNTYSRYECNASEPDFATLKRIAKFYDVSIDYLLENDDEAISDTPHDLLRFIECGNYTIFSRFPSQRDRRMLIGILCAIWDETFLPPGIKLNTAI